MGGCDEREELLGGCSELDELEDCCDDEDAPHPGNVGGKYLQYDGSMVVTI